MPARGKFAARASKLQAPLGGAERRGDRLDAGAGADANTRRACSVGSARCQVRAGAHLARSLAVTDRMMDRNCAPASHQIGPRGGGIFAAVRAGQSRTRLSSELAGELPKMQSAGESLMPGGAPLGLAPLRRPPCEVGRPISAPTWPMSGPTVGGRANSCHLAGPELMVQLCALPAATRPSGKSRPAHSMRRH